MRSWLTLAVLLVPASARALPPVAVASVADDEAVLGVPVAFSSAGTRDPDGDPLTYAWDFGDGATSTEASATHAFDATGAYDVQLTVRDATRSSIALLTVFVVAPPTPTPPRASRSIALSPDGAALFVVNRDSGSVTRLALATSARLEVAPCAQPISLSLGASLFVACAGSDEVVALSPDDLTVRARVSAGRAPQGVVALADGTVLVAWSASDEVTLLDAALNELGRVRTAPGPTALAVTADGSAALVTHFLTRGDTGTVSRLALPSLALATTSLVVDPSPDGPSSGAGYPNLLGTIAIEPSGRGAWVGGLKSNTDRGLFRSGVALVPHNRVRGVMLRVLLADGSESTSRRIDSNNADRVAAIAFSPSGRYAYTAHPGIGAVSVIDLVRAERHDPSDGSPVTPLVRLETFVAPSGLVVSADGATLYVHDPLGREVVVLDVTDPAVPVERGRVAVTDEPYPAELALGERLFHSSRAPRQSLDGYIACASCHPDGGHDGRTWDFTQAGEGLRNTIDLRGRAGVGHGPVHWSANFDEIQDFENDIVSAFGGSGLAMDGLPPHPSLGATPNGGRSAELDALAAYVASLDRFPASPHRSPDGVLSPEALRGRAIFFEPTTRCAECHAPPRFTDSVLMDDPADFVLHDVGTILPSSGSRLGGPLTGLDTPTLLGLWDGAPYLHDGRAATVLDVLTVHNPDDLHGVTSHLDAGELADLSAYLLSLDGRADELPPAFDAGVDLDAGTAGTDAHVTADARAGDAGAPGPTGCACRARAAPPRLPALWIASLLVLVSIRLGGPRCALS